ncbi:MAG: AAA family ATPase [Bryobacteraceae bacterium]
MRDSTFITRVELKNYKSIAACSVRLRPLVFLVGPNGSGKSNFLDSFRFVSDALRTSLDHALRNRGGIGEVRRRSAGHPTHFAVLFDFSLLTGQEGTYWFRIGARPQGGFEVQIEECVIRPTEALSSAEYFKVASGKVLTSSKKVPAASSDRLFLVSASGIPEFRPVYEAFSRMGFYNLNPDSIRRFQPPDAGEILNRDGSNLPSVLRELARRSPLRKRRIEEYLEQVVPGISGVDMKVVGPQETLEFRQQVTGSKNPWRFPVANMSDGTLRALGVLVSLFQSGNGSGANIPLVGIEEPEVALHPAAAGVLLDSLRAASRDTQVIVTSHSPDLLDDDELETESILAVYSQRSGSRIAPLDERGRAALRDRLYTAGELLRQDQLRPDPAHPRRQAATQLSLFGKGVAG